MAPLFLKSPERPSQELPPGNIETLRTVRAYDPLDDCTHTVKRTGHTHMRKLSSPGYRYTPARPWSLRVPGNIKI